MRMGHKNYLTYLLGFSDQDNDHASFSSEKECQSEFDKFRFEKQVTKSASMTFYLCFPLILCAGITIFLNRKPIRPTYFFFAGVFIDIALSFFLKSYVNSYVRLKWFRYLRFFLFYFNLTINWTFPVNPSNDNIFRYAYCLIFYMNFLYNYFLDYNYLVLIFITFLNSSILLAVQYLRELGDFLLLPEILINLIYYYILSLLKISELENEKRSFIESYKNNNYINYIQNLVNVVNTMIISIKNEEILFINDFGLKYFNNNCPKSNNTVTNNLNGQPDIEKLISCNYENRLLYFSLNDRINMFFNSLVLSSTSCESNKKGENFKKIIKSFTSQTNPNSVNFVKIGYFTHNKLKDSCFEIHVRKLNYEKEAIELLIYDISEIKKAEKQAVESKYKHKILAKIAHEFKTPLITIISLSERIVKDQQQLDLDNNTKKNLYYINNLSNYTLSMISDIIHYVSDCMNLRINKNEVNLNEVMDFSNNVLKTLVECNENKSNKIETKLSFDGKLDNIILFTDENRLKQILLNFISNAFKFTRSGYIKLKAKYIYESNLIEISVKDTGIGIKDEEHDLIFKENVQLNLDNEYNSHGSGLGLSIVKNMADNLNYKIGFESTYGKGSKFYIRTRCIKRLLKSKSISLNKTNNLIKDLNSKEVNPVQNINNRYLRKKFINNNDNTSNIKLINNNNLSEIDSVQTIKKNFDLVKFQESFQLISYEDHKLNKFVITGFNICINQSKDFNINTVKLVVVDDHKLVRENTLNILNYLLKNYEESLYEIVECSDGIELLNVLRLDTGNQIKLILTDENMEYLNGSESVRIIRKLQENRKIKDYHIVSITAFDDPETKEMLMSSGVNSIITKPCTKSDLSELLNNFFIPFIIR